MQNLLLTVHENSCYYLAVSEHADFDKLNPEHKLETEVRGLWVDSWMERQVRWAVPSTQTGRGTMVEHWDDSRAVGRW